MKQEKGGGEEGRGWSCNNQEADEQLENAKLAMRRRARRGKARRDVSGSLEAACPFGRRPTDEEGDYRHADRHAN